MSRAWAQVTQILAMNRRMKLGRFAMETAKTIHATFFAKISAVTLLTVAKPVTKKVMGSPTTIHHLVGESLVTSAPLDAAMRRLLRRRGVVARRLRAADPGFSRDRLVEDINDGKVTAAPPRTSPPGFRRNERRQWRRAPPAGWISFIKRYLWWLLLLLLLLVALFFVIGLWVGALACVALAVGLVIIALRKPVPGDVAPASGIGHSAGHTRRGAATAGFGLVETDPPPRPAQPGSILAPAMSGSPRWLHLGDRHVLAFGPAPASTASKRRISAGRQARLPAASASTQAARPAEAISAAPPTS
jgi:hypothetical protein